MNLLPDDHILIDFYKKFNSLTYMSNILHISKERIKRRLLELGLKIGHLKVKNKYISKEYLLNEFIKKERTLKEISEELSLPRSVVKSSLKQYNIKRITNYKNLSVCYFKICRNNALKRNILFTISPEYVSELFEKQMGLCNLSGQDITLTSTYNCGKNQNASLDRIDSSCGYVEGNLQWIHSDINLMKNNLDENYFKQLCNFVSMTGEGMSIAYGDPKYPKQKYNTRINNKYIYSLERSAYKRNILFDIEKEYLWKLLQDQQFKCKLSGMPIYVLSISTRETMSQTASVDRIDSDIGYLSSNVQWVHRDINLIKRNFNEEYFISTCKKISGRKTYG